LTWRGPETELLHGGSVSRVPLPRERASRRTLVASRLDKRNTGRQSVITVSRGGVPRWRCARRCTTRSSSGSAITAGTRSAASWSSRPTRSSGCEHSRANRSSRWTPRAVRFVSASDATVLLGRSEYPREITDEGGFDMAADSDRRPPLMLVHGAWLNSGSWQNFIDYF